MSQAEREKCGMNGRKAPKTRGHAADNPYEVIHILSDINRMQILRLLAEHGELCARDILTFFPITQPTLSHHMNVLLDNHLVEARKSGRWVFYHLSQNGIQEIINFFENLKKSSGVSSANLQKNTTTTAKTRNTGTRASGTRVSGTGASGTRVIKETASPARSASPADSKKIPLPEKEAGESVPEIPSAEEIPLTDKTAGSTEKYADLFSSKKDKKKNKEKDKLSKKDKKKKKNKKK